MLFKKKDKEGVAPIAVNEDITDKIKPIMTGAASVKDKYNELMKEETSIQTQFQSMQGNFGDVMSSINDLGGIVTESRESLENTAAAANRFQQVKNEIFDSVESVKGELDTLKESSDQVMDNFQQMNAMFLELQSSVEDIKK